MGFMACQGEFHARTIALAIVLVGKPFTGSIDAHEGEQRRK
jgi:hypothetical protein